MTELEEKILEIIENYDRSCGCCGNTDCEEAARKIMELLEEKYG